MEEGEVEEGRLRRDDLAHTFGCQKQNVLKQFFKR